MLWEAKQMYENTFQGYVVLKCSAIFSMFQVDTSNDGNNIDIFSEGLI